MPEPIESGAKLYDNIGSSSASRWTRRDLAARHACRAADTLGLRARTAATNLPRSSAAASDTPSGVAPPRASATPAPASSSASSAGAPGSERTSARGLALASASPRRAGGAPAPCPFTGPFAPHPANTVTPRIPRTAGKTHCSVAIEHDSSAAGRRPKARREHRARARRRERHCRPRAPHHHAPKGRNPSALAGQLSSEQCLMKRGGPVEGGPRDHAKRPGSTVRHAETRSSIVRRSSSAAVNESAAEVDTTPAVSCPSNDSQQSSAWTRGCPASCLADFLALDLAAAQQQLKVRSPVIEQSCAALASAPEGTTRRVARTRAHRRQRRPFMRPLILTAARPPCKRLDPATPSERGFTAKGAPTHRDLRSAERMGAPIPSPPRSPAPR